MKKAGIVTYHHYYNYGTALQAYALQRAIDNIEGFEAELIDYRSQNDLDDYSFWELLKIRCSRLFIYVKEWRRIYKTKKYASVFSQKNERFEHFFADFFKTNGDIYDNFDELKKASPYYDIYVTGSDQTWSPKIGFWPAFFLEFGDKKSRRIAYAPSIGVTKLTESESDYLNTHLQQFDAISCRENIGTEVLNNVVKNKTITKVLDPTFLLDQNDWNEIAAASNVEKPYILCYFIGDKPYYREVAKKLSDDLNLPLYYIPVSWQDVGVGNNLLPEAGRKSF